jgi:hypothetical protein
LDVSGSIRTSTSAYIQDNIYLDNTGSIYSKNSAGINEFFCTPRYNNNATYFNCGSGGYNFRNTSSTSIMFLNNNGNIGIGTATSTNASNAKLEVNGDIFCSGYLCKQGKNGTTAGNSFNIWWTGSTLQCWIDTLNVGNFAICDYRVKENITQPENVLDKLCSVNMIDYEFKNIGIFKKDNAKHLGLFAHELQDTFSEYKNLVFNHKDSLSPEGNIQPQSISNDIIFILMKAIQELKNEVDMLKEIINNR